MTSEPEHHHEPMTDRPDVDTLADRLTEAFDARDSILHAELLSDLAARARDTEIEAGVAEDYDADRQAFKQRAEATEGRVTELEQENERTHAAWDEDVARLIAARSRVTKLEARAKRAENMVRDHHRSLAAIGGGPCVCDICALAGDGGGA